MTHNHDDRPKVYPLGEELGWLWHNTVGHTVTGFLCFGAAILYKLKAERTAYWLLDVGDRFHDWTMPSR